MDNPKKLAAYGTQDDEKQSKNTTQYVLYTIILKQTQIRLYYKQPKMWPHRKYKQTASSLKQFDLFIHAHVQLILEWPLQSLLFWWRPYIQYNCQHRHSFSEMFPHS